ncbi:hypothetical protein TrCOL_g10040 [Triparma columacea]|uniref:Lipid desaturase domain-containing protein n=1 Tax=Triparma columacea TaxID=722753 RepID=A0A9W7G628_9STRA|nr:hypothetical protein TrCOL_g10040 [Triparma columacea]
MGKRFSGEEAIRQLNLRVEKKTQQAVDLCKEGEELDVTYKRVLDYKFDGVWAGRPIYVSRPRFPTYLIIAGAILVIIYQANEMNLPLPYFAVAAAMSYLNYDFFSGILHVALDDPRNIKLPLIGQAALEFQWHHAIPTDIVDKDFMDVIGDLNIAVFPILAANMIVMDYGRNRMMAIFMAMKLLMAYFGQFSHREAHNIRAGKFSQFLQKAGFMISVKDHKAHHQPPHEDDFCLIGVCNHALQVMFKLAGHFQYAWLATFVLYCIFDNYILSTILNHLAVSVGSEDSVETWHGGADSGLPYLYGSVAGMSNNTFAA